MDKRGRKPPKLAEKFLKWFCSETVIETLQGDLHELYQRRVERLGKRKADFYYIIDIIDVCRPFAWKKRTSSRVNYQGMLRNNLKLAWRHLLKEQMYSLINLIGFAVGVAACLLIGLFIEDELSYDKHIPNADRIYRILDIDRDDGEAGISFPAPFARALKKDYPEVELVGRFVESELFGAGSKQVRTAGTQQNFFEEGFVYADQGLLNIFQIPMIYGNPKSALGEPQTLVISKRKAEKYFPGEDPVGKTLILNDDDEQPFKIGGVMADFPSTSHFRYDFLISLAGKEFWPGEQDFWRASNYRTYVMLRPDTDLQNLETKLVDIIHNYYLPSWLEAGAAGALEQAKSFYFELQPVTDIHLKSGSVIDDIPRGDIRIVRLFAAIAILILLIAGVNFVNLSTARSANRAREVGLRKVVGSFRGQLIHQFLTESVFFNLISFALGLFIARALLPYFNGLANKSLVIPWQEWWFFPALSVMTIVIGILSGLYPALYLSGFQPIKVLKGDLARGSKAPITRNILVIFQFTVSVTLIIGAFGISRQMDFILNKKLGFEKEQVLLLQETGTLQEKTLAFKEELLKLPQVKHVSVSDYLPIYGTKRNGNGFWREGKVTEDKPIYGQIWRVDQDYLQTMGIKLSEGRDFSIDMPTDSQALIINRTMADRFGFPEPMGQRITNSGDVWTIIGIVEDFHFRSLKDEIGPLCLVIGRAVPTMVSVKVNTSEMSEAVKDVTKVWDDFSPDQSIKYAFLDESYAALYADVHREEGIFKSFAFFAIFIACMGLFALSTYMAEQRNKEIGIRKILGASIDGIFWLLSRDFLRLVLISLLIALPLGWYLMQKWLQDFSYRTDITWDVFLFAGLIALLIAILTISFQALRAATGNPVEVLRRE